MQKRSKPGGGRADVLIGGIPGSWIVARYALVAGQIITLPVGKVCMDWKKRQRVNRRPFSYHRLLCDPLPCAEAHPDHYGDKEVECEPLAQPGLGVHCHEPASLVIC